MFILKISIDRPSDLKALFMDPDREKSANPSNADPQHA
jgi:hypothetical protein